MKISDEYKQLANKDVSMLDVIKYIENDLDVDFNIQTGNVINLRCPSEVLDIESSVHDSSSVTKTAINITGNNLKCYNPACECNKVLDNIGLVSMFYDDLSFSKVVQRILEIGGIEYNIEKRELDSDTKLAILKTNYVREKSDNLMKGYDLIEENKEPSGRYEILYVDAAKYLLARGITKHVARKMKLGIGGGPSKVIKYADKSSLVKAKILSSETKFEIMTKRIIIPNISKGFVVGMTGRAIYDDNRRYLNVGLVKNLINIDKAKKHKQIFMFEGALNGASYEVLTGQDNFVTLQGAETFKREFVSEIIKSSAMFNDETEFIYIADCDSAGLFAARVLGLELLKLGFTLNVVVTPKSKDGKKVDLNDILRNYGVEKGLELWNELLKTAEPYVIFAIKEEISNINSVNPITREIKKAKIIEKYLKLDVINPIERWTIEQHLNNNGYPVTSEFYKYMDLHFLKEPVLSGNKLICFVGEIESGLEEILKENNKEYNVLDVSARTNIYNLDPSIDIVLICSPLYLFKTKKIYQILRDRGHNVRIHYADKELTSLIEYIFAISKSIEGSKFFAKLADM